MIKIGLMGAGQVGQKHAAAIKRLPGAELAVVADLNQDRARRAASGCGAEVVADYEQVLVMDLDAVINALPHHLHHRSSVAAARLNLHMLLEKPICLELMKAREIARLFRQRNLKLMIGYVHRFRQEMLDAKALIDSRKLGDVTVAVDDFVAPSGPDVPEWVWEREKAGGGILMYGGIHGIDRLLWFFGSPARRVYTVTRTYTGLSDVEDGLVASIEFENGGVASIAHNAPRYSSLRGWRTKLLGTVGTLEVNQGRSLTFSSDSVHFSRTYERYDHFGRQLKEFVAAIEEDRDPWISSDDGIRSLAVVLAMYESSQTREPVELAA